ncbi:MAG: 16S rRNA (cytidine(1402)-2'-O)-methyltransferase [Candidatus Moranbacteria bacterium]|nr:16S rRNA (cytidine(1402)-2'-O)-methyltransferase [Candidatus Moranbacteria bacterium]
MNSGILYIIATPIGNLEDITLRALRILKEVDAIACEDTRVTSRLLSHYNISKPLLSLHQHSGQVQFGKIMALLVEGKTVAYVSDAGTPGISDPGNKLVEQVVAKNFSVVPIPGVSALATLISVSGIDMQTFSFLGFPPHKKGRETFFKKVAELKIPVVYYDSPHRVIKNILLLKTFVPEKQLIIGRELTKMFEEIVRGSIEDIENYFALHPEKVKGEFSVVVY